MAKLTESVRVKAVPAARKQRSFLRTNLTGWLFASTWILGLLCFYAIPMLTSIYFSFTTYSILQPGGFVGLNNYRDLFNDPLFWKSIYNTIYFTVFFCSIKHIYRCGARNDVEYESQRTGCIPNDLLLAHACAASGFGRSLDVVAASQLRFGEWNAGTYRDRRAALAWRRGMVQTFSYPDVAMGYWTSRRDLPCRIGGHPG